jgi:glycosyltransferase involved in cell wall biosynthesis
LKILVLHTKYQLQGGEDAVVHQELELLKQHNIVEILYFQNYGGWRGALQFLFSVWNIFAAIKVKQKILEFKPDVVHVHNWHFAMGPLVFRVVNRLNIPIVHTVHNYRLLCPSAILLHKGKLFTDSLQKSFPWKAISNRVYKSSLWLTFWIAFIVWFHKKIGTWKKIDKYICLTSFAVNLFQQSNFGVLKERFTIKPNFVIGSQINQQIEREKYFLFVGRLSEEKGIATLLAAFKELPFVIKIAGEGPLKDEVIKTTQNFPNFIYLGNLNTTEVSKVMQTAQALISPSVCYEGMPMTILEAFSTSTPVITSNLGAMISLVSNESNGFLFEPGDVNELKGTILKFVTLSIDEKKRIGMNAFEDFKNIYSINLQNGYFDAIYNSVLTKS